MNGEEKETATIKWKPISQRIRGLLEELRTKYLKKLKRKKIYPGRFSGFSRWLDFTSGSTREGAGNLLEETNWLEYWGIPV